MTDVCVHTICDGEMRVRMLRLEKMSALIGDVPPWIRVGTTVRVGGHCPARDDRYISKQPESQEQQCP